MPRKRRFHTPRTAHVLAVILVLLVGACVMMMPDAQTDAPPAPGPYNHLVLDRVDAAFAAVLPGPLYQMGREIMQVLLTPTDVIATARTGIGLDHHAAAGNVWAQRAASLLDGILFLAVITGSLVAIVIRLVIRLARRDR